MATELDYISGKTIIPKDAFGISPSGLAKFFSEPHNWYREHVLGEQGFTGSTATYLGTIVHYCAECFIKKEPVNTFEIYKYLFRDCYVGLQELPTDEDDARDFLELNCNHPNIDVKYILSQFEIMAAALIAHIRNLKNVKAEELTCAEVIPGVWASGSIDLQSTDAIYDYKTTSSLSAPKTISYEHKLQLLTYAWIKHQNGTPIKTINIIYVTNNQVNRYGANNKKLEDYPSKAVLLTHRITVEDMDFISSLLKLVGESVQYVKQHPESAYLIFKDYRLKTEQPKQKFTF